MTNISSLCIFKNVNRREYPIQIIINGRKITKAIIDPHYEESHKDSISDEVILTLINRLNGRVFSPVKVDGEFEYFVEDKILLDRKLFKLVWLLQDEEVYVGILNCYRRD